MVQFMNKTKIISQNFAKRMGAYSHGYAVTIGGAKIIFTTGQIALDKDGHVVGKGNIEVQTRYVFESLSKILKEAQATLADIVKVTIYVTHMEDFSKISPIRNEYLGDAQPVSTLVEVNKLVNPDCMIEIEAIAVNKGVNI